MSRRGSIWSRNRYSLLRLPTTNDPRPTLFPPPLGATSRNTPGTSKPFPPIAPPTHAARYPRRSDRLRPPRIPGNDGSGGRGRQPLGMRLHSRGKRSPLRRSIAGIARPRPAAVLRHGDPRRGRTTGLLVESHMGRPTKVEGNPDHPASLGATDAIAQAAPSLYDPDRSQAVRRLGEISTWEAYLTDLRDALQQQEGQQGAGLRILTETVVSPTLHRQLQQILERFPKARWHQRTRRVILMLRSGRAKNCSAVRSMRSTASRRRMSWSRSTRISSPCSTAARDTRGTSCPAAT